MSSPNPRQLLDAKVPMRDGVELSADVLFPATGRAGGPYPVLLERSCYTNQLNEEHLGRFRDHGYAVVLQDVRGRNDSAGDYWPLHQEHDDGFDTVEWLAAQSWCDGNIGTIGSSYMGWTQWATASRRPPHLRAMWVSVPAGLFGQQEPFDHGILMLPVLAWLNLTGGRSFQSAQSVDWHAVYRHLPLVTMDEALGRPLPRFREWLSHPTVDDYWRQALVSDYRHVDVPTVVTTGWWDSNVKGGIELHRRLVEAGHPRQHLIVGPWDHVGIGEMTSLGGVSFGDDARVDMFALQLRWFDHWLKQGAPLEQPRVRIFVTGENRWRDDSTWPPASAPLRLYLHSDGDAGGSRRGVLSECPPGTEPSDSYDYDPLDPVVVVPGNWDFYSFSYRGGLGDLTLDGVQAGAFADPVTRPDVLVYESEALSGPWDVIGEPSVELYASADGPDTDWFVALDDLFPDGTVLPINIAQLRARFREGLDKQVPLEPGVVTRFMFPGRPMAHRFDTGHRVRLTVTSSRFPVADRNPNTGAAIDADDPSTRISHNVVFHDASAPSHVLLPLVQAPAPATGT